MLGVRELDPDYMSAIDAVDEPSWCRILLDFDDANIYQTWSYAEVISGRGNMSHLVLRRRRDIVAVAQARIARIPFTNIGFAYVRWGPLWRRRATAENPEVFRQVIRALRNEFACKRGLALRLFPVLFEDDSSYFSKTLIEEGFSASNHETRSRTILMDVNASLEVLRQGMGRNWRRSLRRAEESDLEIIEGSELELFKAVIDIYNETVSRKRFMVLNDIRQLTLVQTLLPKQLKMRVMLCRSGDHICAGLIWSAIGRTAVELVAATSNIGIRSNGSHLLRWKLIETLKQNRFAVYNLNGINPITNPGTYRFKSELAGKNGRDIHFLGRFDTHDKVLSHWCVVGGDMLKATRSQLGRVMKSAWAVKLSPRKTIGGD